MLPDGSSYFFQGRAPGPHAQLQVNGPRFLYRFLTQGHNGFADAYIDGDCETPDLAALLEVTVLNEEVWTRTLDGGRLARTAQRLFHMSRANSKAGSKRNIAHHYDLGNRFFETWLDPSMTYSSAVFEHPEQSLEDAQNSKYRRMIALADIKPDHHVLEIGCGWGGFAVFAARELGCRVTAITISEQQFLYARQRVAAAGLSDRIEIKRLDYRDVDGGFDRIVSIEMFEAVGERYWPTFFDKIRSVLAPGGRAGLQIITIHDDIWERYRTGADFIQRYIFPGGMLPAPTILRRLVTDAGLAWQQSEAIGPNYAKTLEIWQYQFLQAWPAIQPLGFDERFRRLWTYYLCYCEVGFATGQIDVEQVALSTG